MPQMTPAGVRVVDPVLTEIARGYTNGEAVYQFLFPEVPVGARGGQIIEFTREHFRRIDTRRAPGANVPRVSYGHSAKRFALEDHALDAVTPIGHQQDAAVTPGYDLMRTGIFRAQRQIMLAKEINASVLAQDVNQYAAANRVALSGTSQWSDPASQPITAVADWKEAVRSRIGMYPNTMVLGPKVYAKLQAHPQIKANVVSRNDHDVVVTTDLLAHLFGVPRVAVGQMIFDDASGASQDVWGKNVVLAYTAIGTLAEMGEPSFGYTYQLRGYPNVSPPREDENIRSWLAGVDDAYETVIVGADAGFLASNVVA